MTGANDNHAPKRFVCDPLAYGVPEAAYAFSISESLVWIWIREGKLKTFKVGARTLITREEMLRRLAVLVEEGSRPTAA